MKRLTLFIIIFALLALSVALVLPGPAQAGTVYVTASVDKPRLTRAEMQIVYFSSAGRITRSSVIGPNVNLNVGNGQALNMLFYDLGTYSLYVRAAQGQDTGEATVPFELIATVPGLKASVMQFYQAGYITDSALYSNYQKRLDLIVKLDSGKADKKAVNALLRSLAKDIELNSQGTNPVIFPRTGELLRQDITFIMNANIAGR